MIPMKKNKVAKVFNVHLNDFLDKKDQLIHDSFIHHTFHFKIQFCSYTYVK